MNKVITLIIFVYIFNLFSIINAIAPPHPSLIYKMRRTGKLKAFYKKRIKLNSNKKQFAPQRATKKLVKTGASKVIVIPIEFSDVKFNKTNDEIKSSLREILFGSTSSVQKYYKEVSNNNFYPTEGIISDIVTSSHTKSYYGGDGSGIDDQNVDIWNLVVEAVDKADSSVDFSQYDNDGNDGSPNTSDDDGFVDHIFIFHAGGAQEASGISSDIWSHRWAVSDNENYTGLSKDGTYISTYIMMSLSSPMGIIAHEFGHDLGFFDIYDTDYSSKGIGNWGLMSGGVWGGNGSNRDGSAPAWPSAWHLKQAGWLNVTDITNSAGSKTLVDIHSSHSAYMIGLDNKGVNSHLEYFLIVNRQKPSSGYDSEIPGSGMLIWHIDDNILTKYSDPNQYNANENHPLVKLVQADGLDNLENSVNDGDSQDPFYSRNFDNKTNPKSFSYDNSYYAVLNNISSNASSMTFDNILKYNIGIFQNPADEQEIIVSVKPSFHLYNDTMSVYIYESGTTTEVQTKAYSSSSDSHTVFSGSYRLSGTYGNVSIKISAKDDTNTLRESSTSITDSGYLEFQSAPVKTKSFSISSKNSEFNINFQDNSIKNKKIMLCYPKEDDDNTIMWSVSKAELTKSAEVSFNKVYLQNTSIYIKNSMKWEFLETKYKNNKYYANTYSTSDFRLFTDNEPPIISKIDKDENIIYCKDNLSGLKQLTIKYSDGTKNIIQGGSNKEKYYAQTSNIIEIETLDKQGNNTIYRASQKAPISINKISVYPNPCVDELIISYKLSLAADHIILKIYDVNGDRVYTTRDYNVQNDEISWDTNNEKGEPVSSGIYYYKLSIFNGNDEEIKKGKFAVLR